MSYVNVVSSLIEPEEYIYVAPPRKMKKQSKRTRSSPLDKIPKKSDFWHQYRIVEKLGSGFFGEVWSIERFKDKKIFALKILIGEENKPDYIESTKKEILALKKIQANYKCNLVKYYDFFQVSWPPNHPSHYEAAILMEYVKGETAKVYIENNDFSESDYKSIFSDILTQLACIHSAGFLHRDIKPGNIIISKENHIYSAKLVDFGLSCFLKPNNIPSCDAKPRVGAEDYLPSDILYLGKPNTKESDIFSLGLTFLAIGSGDEFEGHRISGETDEEKAIHFNTLLRSRLVLNFFRNVNDESNEMLSDIVRSMLDSTPQLRPTAENILKLNK